MGNNLSLAYGKFVEQLGNSGGWVPALAGIRGAQNCLYFLYTTDK
jgi:hypothetical protein